MPSKSNNSPEPSSSSRTGRYERYRHIVTEEGSSLIYDTEVEDGWIQSQQSVRLDAWR